MLRQPILVFMGNVDVGKTQLLDTIRNTTVASKEVGGITQAIGASIIPLDTIKKICGQLLSGAAKLKVSGILTVDTPGHDAFTNLRKRGGNLADIAVLVIDINEGIKPQTLECISILKQYKTPFVIALNKIDLIPGWKSNKDKILLEDINSQSENVHLTLEKKLYEIVEKLNGQDLQSDRFDRVSDYTKQLALVPTSAKTGEGIPELLMVLMGLCQKYLSKNLLTDSKDFAKGTVLEVKEEKGLGKTLDVIIYYGKLKKNDTIVIGTLDDPIVSKVKGLFEPTPLSDMRDKRTKFKAVKEVTAAIGVKISGNGLDKAVAGMPLRASSQEGIEKVKEEIKKEVSEVVISTDKEGIIIKADSLGSLEALEKLLKENSIKIKKATIGDITKKDIMDAKASFQSDPMNSVVVGFNVRILPGINATEKVEVIKGDIIHKLIDDFKTWQDKKRKGIESKEIEFLVRPCKIKILRGYIFRQSNPAVVGVEILSGKVCTGMSLMKADGKSITEVKSIQQDKENVKEAEKGKQVAVSLTGITIGRQVQEDTVLYSSIPETHFRKLKEFKKYLSQEEIELLKEIAKIMRKDNTVWGV